MSSVIKFCLKKSTGPFAQKTYWKLKTMDKFEKLKRSSIHKQPVLMRIMIQFAQYVLEYILHHKFQNLLPILLLIKNIFFLLFSIQPQLCKVPHQQHENGQAGQSGLIYRKCKIPLQVLQQHNKNEVKWKKQNSYFCKEALSNFECTNVSQTQDEKLASVISWLPEQNWFQILNVSAFVQEVLPSQFKHKNMASFVRQLNMYGFSRPLDSHQNVYMHPKFQKGNFNNLRFIRRRAGYSRQDFSQQDSQLKSEEEEQEENENNNHQYQKLCSENEQLKRQNEGLKLRLLQFEEITKKVKNISLQMNSLIDQSYEETENERNEKQANSSDSTSTNSSNVGKSGFNYCKNNCQSDKNERYNILLNGSEIVGLKQS